ncbi:MAG: Glutamate synthase domain 3 [Candidatus Methanohalarchaeum thermophilum]|uniref:Glutamate synthase domain 3 n=1 Tax=Methanohalarchaeum thermophilum TaxID=1903181 RepID=A0A1Q6DX90_METT1|nr:MAG: Glutamate synthase domain 3 [Candidatus Methanohalarchaeum thermophilum]
MKEINVDQLEPREINNKIKRTKETKIKLKNMNADHFICAGITKDINVKIEGSVGYYAGTMLEEAEIDIEGNAGNQIGENMHSGKIKLKGSAGDGAGQGMYGGTLIINETAGSRTGGIMKDGEIIVKKYSDLMTGVYMMGGKIIVTGDLGDSIGESMIGGTIYFSGKIEGLGKNAEISETNDKDQKYLQDLIREHELDTKSSKFKKITPKNKRPHYGD